jgi:hypothetical protein
MTIEIEDEAEREVRREERQEGGDPRRPRLRPIVGWTPGRIVEGAGR